MKKIIMFLMISFVGVISTGCSQMAKEANKEELSKFDYVYATRDEIVCPVETGDFLADSLMPEKIVIPSNTKLGATDFSGKNFKAYNLAWAGSMIASAASDTIGKFPNGTLMLKLTGDFRMDGKSLVINHQGRFMFKEHHLYWESLAGTNLLSNTICKSKSETPFIKVSNNSGYVSKQD